jgi:hypothetical protein
MPGPACIGEVLPPDRGLRVTALTTLYTLATRINEFHSAAERDAKSAMMHALNAGSLLSEAKAQVPHGEWEQWVRENCTLAPRTANAYMRLAKKLPQLPEPDRQRVADLPVREAVRAIATSPDAPPRSSAIHVHAREDADRAVNTFDKSGRALREAAKWIHRVRQLDSRRVTSLRAKLQAALNELDRLDTAEVHT